MLADVVQQGRGLILLGGRHSFGPGRYQTTPLADVMPVVMHDYEAQDFDAPLNSALHLERELSLQPTQEHFLTRLSGDEGTSQWSSLPPLLGANRFSEVKRDARVLLETERGEPMLVAGNPGGRVIAFAGDSTWRWWTMGHSEAHRRFWRQMVLWAAGLDSLGQDAIVIDMARRRFNQRSPVEAAVGAGRLLGTRWTMRGLKRRWWDRMGVARRFAFRRVVCLGCSRSRPMRWYDPACIAWRSRPGTVTRRLPAESSSSCLMMTEESDRRRRS
ncbi:MAG: glutamine amidotransferase [Pirellulaceae bacterium]